MVQAKKAKREQDNSDGTPAEKEGKPLKSSSKKAKSEIKLAEEGENVKPVKAKKDKKSKAERGAEGKEAVTEVEAQIVHEEAEVNTELPSHKLYTLKFNSPILPFAKFPLT